MDPEENLREQRRIKARIKAKSTQPGDYGRLRELQQALREWKSRGGYMPKAPRKPRKIRLKARVAKKIGAIARAKTGRRTPTYKGVRRVAPPKKKATNPDDRFTLTRIPTSRKGHSRQGTFYGAGEPVFYYQNDDRSITGKLRAKDRREAKAKIRAQHGKPRARFHK